VSQVAKVVTPENKDELLPRFFRLSLTPGRTLSARAQRRALRPNPLVHRKALQGKVPQGRRAPCASLHGA
jgi:hypothetical protein